MIHMLCTRHLILLHHFYPKVMEIIQSRLIDHFPSILSFYIKLVIFHAAETEVIQLAKSPSIWSVHMSPKITHSKNDHPNRKKSSIQSIVHRFWQHFVDQLSSMCNARTGIHCMDLELSSMFNFVSLGTTSVHAWLSKSSGTQWNSYAAIIGHSCSSQISSTWRLQSSYE